MPILPAWLLQQRRVLAMQPCMGATQAAEAQQKLLFSSPVIGCKRTVAPNILLAEIRLIAEKNNLVFLEQTSVMPLGRIEPTVGTCA